MIAIIVTIVLLVGAYFIFTNFYPSFGGDVSKEQKESYKNSSQYQLGQFHNTNPVPKKMSLTETLNLAYTFFTTKVPNGRPNKDLKTKKIDSIKLSEYSGESRLIWFGHSSFLLQIQNQNILIDPMFGQVAAPHPLLGANRFNKEFPIAVEKISRISAVIYSHDHYDHLDYETVLKIKDKTEHFYVPLGLSVHLIKWGVSPSKITELDWWQEVKFNSIKLICTPSQHFSGRKINNSQSTLWSSWVIKGQNDNIYFSGDSGYSQHFKEIGDKYGPFDIALMECGQYNEKWPDIHMMPEETAIAGIDIQAKTIMPIHWAGFKLALHEWTDPIKRVKTKSKELGLNIITPEIGDEILIKKPPIESKNWWNNY